MLLAGPRLRRHLRLFWRRSRALLLGLLGIALFFGIWELAPRVLDIHPLVLPTPQRISVSLWRLLLEGDVLVDIGATTRAYGLSFVGACLVGVAIGALAGRVEAVQLATDPVIWFLYSTPLISIYPLLIVWFGLGFRTVVALGFMLSVIPIAINTTAGFKDIDPQFIDVAQSFGLSERQMTSKVMLPGSMPMVLAGVRVASGRALTGVVIGEMFAGTAGLGYQITAMAARVRLPEVFAYLFIVVVFGVLVTQAARFTEDRILSWRPAPT